MKFFLLSALISIASASLLPYSEQQSFFASSRFEEPEFEVLTSNEFKRHQIRVRQPKGLCDPDVKQYSGYLDTVEGRHHYFWLFESRNDPKNDPVVMWLNGGPGCSSFTGLLMELGPCRVMPEGQNPKFNPYSWNENATLLFLDQPVGVGYSYADKSDRGVWRTEDAAIDVYAFLRIFFDGFADKYGHLDFHIAGESYAGRYIPVFADYITQQNKIHDKQVPLKSVLIGNGFTHARQQYSAYYPTVCTNSTGYGPYVAEDKCTAMRNNISECVNKVEACWDDPMDPLKCSAASDFCEDTQTAPYYDTGRNAYDMRKFGDYPEENWVHYFLNRVDVRHQLGVDKEQGGGVREFIGCSDLVGYRFSAVGDNAQKTYPHVASLLDNGVAVLIYAGRADFICNWYGNHAWTLELDWFGKEGYNDEILRDWYASESDKIPAGQYHAYENLAFAIVDESGHFVPYDKPYESLAMFNGWVHNQRFW